MKNILLSVLVLMVATLANGQCYVASIQGPSAIQVGRTISLADSTTGGTWSSSNAAIATINPSTGYITAIACGNVNITYSLSGACSGYYITRPTQITSGFIGHNKVCIGDTTRLKDTLTIGAWSSSNTSVASINSTTGLITGLTTGSAVITYSFTILGIPYNATDTFKVAIVPNVGTVTGSLDACPGGNNTLIDTFTTVVWRSSNSGIVNVYATHSDTGFLHSYTSGSVIITYTSDYCTLAQNSVTFTVHNVPSPGTITETGITLCKGDTATFHVVGATGSSGYWYSGAADHAIANSSGLVTATAYGYWGHILNTIYHVSTSSFGCSASTYVYMYIQSEPIRSIPAGAGILAGPSTLNLGTTSTYSTGTNGYWTSENWSISSSSVAAISSPGFTTVYGGVTSTGIATGLSIGTATIRNIIFTSCASDTEYKTITVLPPEIGAVSSGFSSFINRACSSPQFGVSVPSHPIPYLLKTIYGDGTTDTTAIVPSSVSALTTFTHLYNTSGNYSIKQVLYSGSIPLDSVTYSYQHLLCRDLHVSFYIDNNDNCSFDSATEHLNNLPITVMVDSSGLPKDTISVTSGLYYQTWGTSGSIYTFRVAGIDSPLHFSCPVSGVIHDTLVNGGIGTGDKKIALGCSSIAGFDLLQNTTLRAGRHMASGSILIENLTCTPQNATVTLNISPKYIFQSSTPNPTSIVGNTVTWNFTGVAAGSQPQTINYSLDIPTSVWLIPGDTVHNTITVAPITGDLNPSNNVIIRIDTVKSSYDPNHISVNPEGSILNGTKLHYAIEFENDGNDTARNIYVMDTLSDAINLSTFRLVGASAAMNIAVLHSGGHNILKFEFPNIKLLDSSHHGRCTGTVFYTINTKTGLANGTQIYAHAGIYFDDNSVVLTDTVTNTILIPHLSIATTTSDTICVGNSVHLTASSASVNTPHYHWYINSVSAGTDSLGLTIPTANPGDTIKCVMITIMDDTIVSLSNSIVLINRGLPNAGTISGPSTVCVGANITLSETVSTGTWSVSGSHASILGGIVHGISAGNATISYSISNVCGTSFITHSVTVNPLPDAGIITGATSVCPGSSTTLSDTATGGTWTISNSHASNSGAIVTGISAGLDTVIYTVNNSCGTAIAAHSITINTSVVPSVSTFIYPGDTVCGGDTVAFTASSVNGGTTPVYQWKNFGSVVATGSTFNYVPANGDMIRCFLMSSAVCPSPDTVISSATHIVVNPILTPSDVISASVGDSVSYLGQIVSFYSTISFCGTSATYQWYKNGVVIPGATNTSYSGPVFSNDTFYCVNHCSTPCSTRPIDTSNILVIYADYLNAVNIPDIYSVSNLSLYPNPNDGSFKLTGVINTFSNETLHFDVIDMTGKVIQSNLVIPKNGVINEIVSLRDSNKNIASGHYMLRLVSGSKVDILQFVVMDMR